MSEETQAPGIAMPPVRGETYFCFTPDQLERVVKAWTPFEDESRNQLMRNAVLAFAYSAEVSDSKIRLEAPAPEPEPAVPQYLKRQAS